MDDLDKETVDMTDNFDDTLQEPTVMPTKIPNLLVNGGNGIAVGMATNMPTHNLGEVIDGCCAYIDNPDIDTDGLMQYIPAPDFPTGATIYGIQGVKDVDTKRVEAESWFVPLLRLKVVKTMARNLLLSPRFLMVLTSAFRDGSC